MTNAVIDVAELAALREQLSQAESDCSKLLAAIAAHHSQKADDRCIEDDDKLYAAAGLPPCDRRVGDKAAMLANCQRFIENRCQGGGWPSYAKLHAALTELAKFDSVVWVTQDEGRFCDIVKEAARKALLPE